MRFLRVLLGALLLVILIAFAVTNRSEVAVSLDPLVPYEIALPLYLLVFLVFFAGLVVGVIAGRWSAWSASRRRAIEEARRRQAEKASETAAAAAPPKPAPAEGAPPLPPAPMV